MATRDARRAAMRASRGGTRRNSLRRQISTPAANAFKRVAWVAHAPSLACVRPCSPAQLISRSLCDARHHRKRECTYARVEIANCWNEFFYWRINCKTALRSRRPVRGVRSAVTHGAAVSAYLRGRAASARAAGFFWPRRSQRAALRCKSAVLARYTAVSGPFFPQLNRHRSGNLCGPAPTP